MSWHETERLRPTIGFLEGYKGLLQGFSIGGLHSFSVFCGGSETCKVTGWQRDPMIMCHNRQAYSADILQDHGTSPVSSTLLHYLQRHIRPLGELQVAIWAFNFQQSKTTALCRPYRVWESAIGFGRSSLLQPGSPLFATPPEPSQVHASRVA